MSENVVAWSFDHQRSGPSFFGSGVPTRTRQIWPHSSHSKYLPSRGGVMGTSKTFLLPQSGQGGAVGEKIGFIGDTGRTMVYRKMALAVCRKPDR